MSPFRRASSSSSLLRIASFAACTGALAACSAQSTEPVAPPVSAASTPAPAAATPVKAMLLPDVGVSPVWMDRSVDACQDFFELACGGLLKNIEIPPDQASWGPGQELLQRTEQFLRDILEKNAKEPGSDPIKKKLGAWYGACMNEDAVDKAGTKPLKELFDVIDKVTDKSSLHAAVIELHKRAIFPLFSIGSQQDFKDATLVIAGLDQGGIGLPDRDYYLDGDARTKDMREFYKGHVERMFGLAGEKPEGAKKATEDVLRIETALAKIAQDKVARRDPHKVYNKIDRKGLSDAAKGFPWDAYFKGVGFPDIKDVSVNSIDYIKGIDALMVQEKPEAWRHYLRWRVLSSQANRLGKPFVDERFKYRQKLTGQKEPDPRWRRCVRSSDTALGELLGQEYVAAKFDAESC